MSGACEDRVGVGSNDATGVDTAVDDGATGAITGAGSDDATGADTRTGSDDATRASTAADPGAAVRVLFDRPCIPPNTGNAIRMSAGAGCELHLAGPLGFELSEPHLVRAGLDYHDLAHVEVHENLEAAYARLLPARVWAFSARAEADLFDVRFEPGDVLLFGPEPTGLAEDVLADPPVTGTVRIPMLPGRRSMNLSNAAAVAVYEAWRQLGGLGRSDS